MLLPQLNFALLKDPLNDEHTDVESGPAAHPHLKFFVVPQVRAIAMASKALLRLLYPDVLSNLIRGNMDSSHRFASLHNGFSDQTALPPSLEELAVTRAAHLSSGAAEFRRLLAR